VKLQAYKRQKTGPGLTVKFRDSFPSPPTVIATPLFLGAGLSVGWQETVSGFSEDDCRIVSPNLTPSNFFVDVLAIDPDIRSFGNLPVVSGTQKKTAYSVTAEFPFSSWQSEPAVLPSPFWLSSTTGVGHSHIETVSHADFNECQVVSPNYAPSDYYINWVAAETGIGTEDGLTLAVGSINKPGVGKLRVPFGVTFVEPPVVLLSAWWKDAGKHVGFVETLNQVSYDYFETVSGNAASTYFVNWLAVGRLG
jgi:hypothetical protein